MMLTDQGCSQGSGATSDWSECSAIEPEPGRAMLAVKFEMMNFSPSTARTISSAFSSWTSSRNKGSPWIRLKTRTLCSFGSSPGTIL
jgi:hypothetical protein